MVRITRSLRYATGFAIVLACVSGNAPARASAADEAAIRAQTTTFVRAYNGGDVMTVVAEYAEDAVLQPPGAPAARGRAAIEAYFAQDIPASAAAGAAFVVDAPSDVGVAGALGWESGSYKVTVKGAVVDTGKYLSISRKHNGRWLYIRDMWNSDVPPPAAPPPAAR